MKYLPLNTLIVGLAASLAGPLSAQTTFNGGDLGNAGNWDNGLPTSVGNPGSIAVNGTVIANPATTYTDYYITQTAGVISFSGSGNDPILSGGTYEQNGGTWGVASGGRGFRTSNGNVTTLTSGKIISGTNGNTSIGVNGSAGATMHVNGGSLETYGIARSILMAAGSTLNINGGTVFTDTTGSATNIFGKNHLGTGNNFINLNGGTTTVNFVAFGNNNSTSQLTITMGGSTVGSFTAVNFKPTDSQELASERRFNWLPGTKMTFRISSADEWAEAEWDAGRLFYNGQSKTDLGDLTWADAINSSIGVGGGYYFVYDSGTETLSLASSGGDVTPPTWTATWPQVDTVGATTFTARAKTDENGTAYYVVLADGATAPNAAEVKAGTAAGGGSALANGSISLTANTENTAAVTGLTEGTAYDVYFVAQDAVPNLQASPSKVDVTTLTAYQAWATGGELFDADANGDGVDNGMAFLLGADTPTSAVTLPAASHSSGNLVLTFSMRNSANRGSSTLIVQHSSDLGIGDPWSAGATVPSDGDGVTFNVTPGSPLDSVIAEISSSEAASGKLFGRLKAVSAP